MIVTVKGAPRDDPSPPSRFVVSRDRVLTGKIVAAACDVQYVTFGLTYEILN